MFDDTIELKDFDKMDPEYKDLLSRVLTIQSDCEIGGPHLYVEHMLPARRPRATSSWSPALPPKRSTTSARWPAWPAISAPTCRTCSAGATTSATSRRSARRSPPGKTTRCLASWSTAWASIQLDEFLDCSYAPLDRAVQTMAPEEEGHIEFGTVESAELAAQGGERRSASSSR